FYSHVICPVSPDCPCRSPSAGRRGFASFGISSRRRSCGKVEIPLLLRDFQGTVGTVGNRFLVFHRFHGPGFSTALRPLSSAASQRLAIGPIATNHMRTVTNRNRFVQMLMDDHGAACQRAPEPAFLQLPPPFPDGHGVVLVHHSLGLYREHPLQIRPRCAPKGGSLLGRLHPELFVEQRYIPLSEKSVGLLHLGDSRQPQLLRQPSLPSLKIALTAPTRLRGVGRDHLHPQLFHRPPHLRQPVLVYLPAGLRGHEKMTPPVAVQRTEQTLVPDHFPQTGHHRPSRFFLHH